MPLEKFLPQGEKAPNSGVLVPEDAYRFYQEDVFHKNLCESTLKNTQRECAEGRLFSGTSVLVFVGGFLAGFLLGHSGGR